MVLERELVLFLMKSVIVDDDFEVICFKCLEKKLEDWYEFVMEFVEDLCCFFNYELVVVVCYMGLCWIVKWYWVIMKGNDICLWI